MRQFPAGLAVPENRRLEIVGGSGSGKTHLLHALGRHVRELSPFLKVGLTTTNDLTRSMVEQFKRDPANDPTVGLDLGLVLVDDFEVARDKPQTWVELNRILTGLLRRGAAVVTTSRLSRLQGQVHTVRLVPPDARARREIASRFVKERGAERWRSRYLDVAEADSQNVGDPLGRLRTLSASLGDHLK